MITTNDEQMVTSKPATSGLVKLHATAEKEALECMSTLFKTELLADVTLCVADKQFKAHRAILSARSPVFAAMFANHAAACTGLEHKVTITDMEKPDVFEQLLHFIYRGRVEKMDCNAVDLRIRYGLAYIDESSIR